LNSCIVGVVAVDEARVTKQYGKCTDAETNLPELKEFVLSDILRLAKDNNFNSMEKPKNLFLISNPFNIEGQGQYDILTPTMKIKRNVARDQFKEQIATMYANITAK